jgi:uncharacterized membrane protein YozB (DUF420 family)
MDIDKRDQKWDRIVMLNSFTIYGHSTLGLRRILLITCVTAILGFVIYIAVKGFWLAFDNDDFPESLAVKMELLPIIFPVHMITGALALLLLPVTYALRHASRWHRIVGRITALDVLISGITAFPVALVAPVTAGSAAGFTAQAAAWIILLILGVRAIRNGNIAAHRAYMFMMAATTSGAIFFRVYLALWAKYGSVRYFEVFYIFDAWAAWMLPLILCAAIMAYQSKRSPFTDAS